VKLVVDASVAVKWYTPEIRHDEAKKLLDLTDTLIAPELIVSEVTNAAWAKARRGEITEDVAKLIAAWIGSGTPALRPAAKLNARALAIALILRHPVYDCLYLACAELESALPVTDDCRFLQILRTSKWRHLAVPLADASDRLARSCG
jgi:predicted nucleic acid-binding protein